jgi:pimeloyl-ACP methyl ester carboxylesterase
MTTGSAIISDIHITLVPGAAGLGSFWDPILQVLPAGWAARALDLPGFGHCRERPDIQSHVDLVEYVARSMSGPGMVAGQSMGAYLALELALRHPQLVTHLVLVVAAGGVDMARHGALDWRVNHRKAHPSGPAWVYAPLPDLTPQLGRITIPVLLVWANRDPISPLGVAEHLRGHLPNATLMPFDTDDHWVARQFAVPVAQAMADVAGQSSTV